MRKSIEFNIQNTKLFVYQMLKWGSKLDDFVLLNSNRGITQNHAYSNFDFVAACSPVHTLKVERSGFESLRKFNLKYRDWIFGFLGYDLKNEIENLSSKNLDRIGFPDIFFYVPKFVFILQGCTLRIEYLAEYSCENQIVNVFKEICNQKLSETDNKTRCVISQCFIKQEYLEIIEKIKNHILLGDVYEMNFCQEFYMENTDIEPVGLYYRLNTISPAPFSAFLRSKDKYLISSSPERFLAKRGNKIISQPIKGTISRGKTHSEDLKLKRMLFSNEKERAENIMIVDLVRNDLSKTGHRASVKVEELCGIYTYPQVHQMISTVTSEMNPDKFDITDVIRYAFPMGSMTGAPKIKAMELIEKYERTKRGLFSGSVGYIAPNQDFDFNVVIRSILYNSTNRYLSFQVGSAITYQSDAEKEYEECLLKAKGMLMALD